jgi:hypothetical protein
MAENTVSAHSIDNQVPAFEPIRFSVEQVELMVRFAAILDPTLEIDHEGAALPPQIGRRFNLKKDGDQWFTWSPAA